MTIKCDATAASAAMRHRYQRFEAMACHIHKGIKDGITEHNRHESGHGFLPAAPEEISMSLAEAVATLLNSDTASIERFIENVRLSMTCELLHLL